MTTSAKSSGRSNVYKYLNLLQSPNDKRLSQTYVINHFRTSFEHEFRVGLKVNLALLHKETAKIGVVRGKAVPWFIRTLIEKAAKNQKTNKHLVIIEGILIHGTSQKDIELTVLTDNGIRGIYHYVLYDLMQYPYITDVITHTISYCHSRQSVAGSRLADTNAKQFAKKSEPVASSTGKIKNNTSKRPRTATLSRLSAS